MSKWLCLLIFCFLAGKSNAQNVTELQQTAQDFIRQGDYENATIVLKRALEIQPDNKDTRQSLCIVYYSQRRYPQALEVLSPLLSAQDTEEQIFQMAGMIYRSQLDLKEAEKVYKTGLKKYPTSGVLYNEFGELMEDKVPGQGEGIKLWEKAIELDPAYSKAYYNAAKYYALQENTVWALVYGEIFVNLESFSTNTVEIKILLYDQYKKAFAYGFSGLNNKNAFENKVSEALLKQKQLAGKGITPEILTAMRSRFILDWFYSNDNPPAFRLFERQRQLLREGLFDAYNQWLFGAVANMAAYQNWTQTNASTYQAFNQFQRGTLFGASKGQYYRW